MYGFESYLTIHTVKSIPRRHDGETTSQKDLKAHASSNSKYVQSSSSILLLVKSVLCHVLRIESCFAVTIVRGRFPLFFCFDSGPFLALMGARPCYLPRWSGSKTLESPDERFAHPIFLVGQLLSIVEGAQIDT